MRTDYIRREQAEHLLSALMPQNRLALEVSLSTGLRLGDVLNIKTCQLKQRMSVVESKTGKRKTVRLSNELLDELLRRSGNIYAFEHRTDPRKHRTRQAVWKDLKRASKLFRLPSALNVAPHSMRKIYAVGKFKRTCNIKDVQALLNHSNEAVTWLYVNAELLAQRKAPQYFEQA